MFTVVFRTQSQNLSYRLVFEPCPCWVKNDENWLINLNPENPQYQKGGVRRLIEQEKLYRYFEDDKECMIIIQNQGYGDYQDYINLEQDLIEEGFSVQVCSFPKKYL